MRISIIKNRKIQTIILPNKIEGNFWISDTDSNGIKRNLISIEAENNRWKLISNNEVYYIKDNLSQPFVYLTENNFYLLRNSVENTDILLYCSTVVTDYEFYEINEYLEKGISIGSDPKSLICYNFIDKKAVSIKKIDNKIFVIDNDSQYGVYVNNVRINKQKELKIGDVIFVLGLKMMFVVSLGSSNEISYYLGINNKLGSNNLDISVNLLPSGLAQSINLDFKENDQELEYPLYDEKEYFHKTPRFVYSIKPLVLQVDPPPAKQDDENSPFLLTIGPMLTMAMTSMVTGYSTLSNISKGETTWSKAMPSLIMCGAMLASVLVWPLFTKWYEKGMRRKKKN